MQITTLFRIFERCLYTKHVANITIIFNHPNSLGDNFHFMCKILSRIEELSKHKGITIGALEKKIGASKGVLSRAISKGKDIQAKWIESLVENYPEYSTEWLLTGKGTMLKPTTEKQRMTVESIRSDSLNKGVPCYNVDFLRGFNLTFNDQTINPEYNIDFKPFNKPEVTWVNITGHSMEPKINHEDIIALKECRLEDVQYGEIYAVVLDTIRTVKILRKAKDPNRMRYIPINEENYDEQEYDNSRILRIFEVLGNISRFM